MRDESTCFKCGANAWTSCEHREAVREKPEFVDTMDRREKAKLRSGGGAYGFRSAGSGINFKTRKST